MHPERYTALLARVGGDEQIARELCAAFLADAPMRLATMADAVASGDAGALQSAAHAFKGAAAVFEAADVVAAARCLELLAAAGNVADGARAWSELEARGRALIDEIRACRS